MGRTVHLKRSPSCGLRNEGDGCLHKRRKSPRKNWPLGFMEAAGARASHSTVSAPWATEHSPSLNLAWNLGMDSLTPTRWGHRLIKTTVSTEETLCDCLLFNTIINNNNDDEWGHKLLFFYFKIAFIQPVQIPEILVTEPLRGFPGARIGSATHQILRLELGPMSPRFQGMGTQTSPGPENQITCRVPLARSYYS